MIHCPPINDPSAPMWQQLLEIRDAGFATAVGVSNYSIDQVDELIEATGVAPAVNQIPWSPQQYDEARLAHARSRGVVVEGYSPFRGSDLAEPVLTEVAAAHGVTAAQVILCWHVQRDTVVIPKSANPDRAVPESNRHWLEPATMAEVERLIDVEPVDLVYGGWGQDGHVAYNQARRNPYSELSVEDVRASTVRIQENNLDTVIALAQRELGTAYQFVPPMSVTLGMRQILAAKKIRLFSDTGAWKQTSLRVGLFSPPDSRYPVTQLQEHGDALLTATRETADHPISHNPDWVFGL